MKIGQTIVISKKLPKLNLKSDQENIGLIKLEDGKTYTYEQLEKMKEIKVKNLDLFRQDLKEFPSWVKKCVVSGDFNCNENKLTSLEGAPKTVGRDFWCTRNKLTSLKGAPESVGGGFFCLTNKLTSLEGAPKTVGRHFWCGDNKLTSLKGAPQSVGGCFLCLTNKLTSLEGAPKTVGGNFDCSRNTKKFTEEDVKAVSKVKGKIRV